MSPLIRKSSTKNKGPGNFSSLFSLTFAQNWVFSVLTTQSIFAATEAATQR